MVEKAIRHAWEKPAPAGSDGAQTVTLQSIKIGRPRPWRIADDGGGQPGTSVYPAKVHWTLRTHYRTRTVVLEREWIFSCFRNGFDEWVVQQSGEPGQTEQQREEPSTMKQGH